VLGSCWKIRTRQICSMPKHFILPDTQVKPGVPNDHLRWAGEYVAEKKPDRIIHIGDHWDMPSLSDYDKGKKSFEGRTYVEDIRAGLDGMDEFLRPITKEIRRVTNQHRRRWNPSFDFFIGNHEERVLRAINADRKLEGLIGYSDFKLAGLWNVHPFLQPVVLDGIAYCHYFTTGVMGRPATSARALLTKKHMSCVMGHVQKRDIAYDYSADGRQITGIFAGTFYQHDEEYLNPQGNRHWRGCWMLHQVSDGEFDEMPLSLDYLRKRYA
jgi:hypothetical protein